MPNSGRHSRDGRFGPARREGDLLRMTWAQYRLRLRQAKTGTLLEVSCHAELKAALDGAPRRSPLILTTPTGRAWTEYHFCHRWKAAMASAQIEGLREKCLTSLTHPAKSLILW